MKKRKAEQGASLSCTSTQLEETTKSILLDTELSLLLHWIVKEYEWMARIISMTEHMELETSLLYLCRSSEPKNDEKGNGWSTYKNNLPAKLFQHLMDRNLGIRGRSRFATVSEDEKTKKLVPTIIWDRFYEKVNEDGKDTKRTAMLRCRSVDNKTEIISKESIERKTFMMPQNKYAFSVHLRREYPMGSILPLGYKLAFVRKKYQVTAWWNKLPFRTDFVKVWQGATEEQVNAQGRDHCRHEIETEFVSSDEDLQKCWLRREDLRQWTTERIMGDLFLRTCSLLPLSLPLSFHHMPPELRSFH